MEFTSTVYKNNIIYLIIIYNYYLQACYHKPDKFIFSNWGKERKKYLPEDGQKLTETCWRILRLLKQTNNFNVLF